MVDVHCWRGLLVWVVGVGLLVWAVGVDVGVGWWCGVLAWDFEVKALRSSSM